MNKLLESSVKILFVVLAVLIVSGTFLASFYLGFYNGYSEGSSATRSQLASENNSQVSIKEYVQSSPTPQATQKPTAAQNTKPSYDWTGPQLWEAVNARRTEKGVNPLSKRDEICTIASIRLNQLLELGKLDAHEGFSKLPEERSDLKWIYEKYTLTEFLVSGATSADEAVSLWENTLGHSKLLTGGEYVWGCIYAQAGFAVAITAY